MAAGNLRERLCERAYFRGIRGWDIDVVGDEAALAAEPRWLKLGANRDLRAVAGDVLGRGNHFRSYAANFTCGERTLRAACEGN